LGDDTHPLLSIIAQTMPFIARGDAIRRRVQIFARIFGAKSPRLIARARRSVALRFSATTTRIPLRKRNARSRRDRRR